MSSIDPGRPVWQPRPVQVLPFVSSLRMDDCSECRLSERMKAVHTDQETVPCLSKPVLSRITALILPIGIWNAITPAGLSSAPKTG